MNFHSYFSISLYPQIVLFFLISSLGSKAISSTQPICIDLVFISAICLPCQTLTGFYISILWRRGNSGQCYYSTLMLPALSGLKRNFQLKNAWLCNCLFSRMLSNLLRINLLQRKFFSKEIILHLFFIYLFFFSF